MSSIEMAYLGPDSVVVSRGEVEVRVLITAEGWGYVRVQKPGTRVKCYTIGVRP